MPSFTRLLIPCCLAGALWGVSVQAQATEQVYRCGQSYQAEPCPGGRAVVVGDARDDAARREAQKVSQREAKAAQQMQAERLQRTSWASTANGQQAAVVRHRAAEAAASAPKTEPAAPTHCTRKSGLRTSAVGGCRDEMLYTAPGSGPKSKAGTNTQRRQTP
ncbi:MAG: hypothetical protein U5L74_09800 [Ideonella sp.]|nr:hypothetical protein [Ideonella sp.]